MLSGDDYFMREALREAHKAFEQDEVPVGAVVVSNNKIIARAHNLTERLHDVTAHAEMQVITAASNHLGAKYLTDCILYVTLEPCVMCAGALYWSQLAAVIYGASDPKRGFVSQSVSLHPRTTINQGILEEDCAILLKQFFSKKRS